MAQSMEGLFRGEFSYKKDSNDDIPVAPCQGWTDSCEFCDKRFGNWVEVDEEMLEKVPTKPGILMIALKRKNVTEVVDIVLDKSDLQKKGYSSIDVTKERIADKKSKATKSVILLRWMTFKQVNDKDVVNLCAHWYNNGVLPKRLESWPGLDILEKTDSLMFSEHLQKWCYPKKDAFWRKPKSSPTKLADVVQGCDWKQPCDICDSNFGEWKNVDNVVYNDLSPDDSGIYMLSIKYGKDREVVNICYDSQHILLNIRNALKNTHKSLSYVLKNKKFVDKSPVFQVRWLVIKNADTDNCCFLYAHWLNSETIPMMNHTLPGEQVLGKNKYFVLRTRDQKWCYEVDLFSQAKHRKVKNKKQILGELEEDLHNLSCSD